MEKQLELRYCLICETVIKDSQSGALSFINIKNNCVMESLPATLPKMFVVFGFKILDTLTSYPYQLHSQLKIISPDNTIVLDLHQRVNIKKRDTNKIPIIDIIFGLDKFTARLKGVYRVQLLDFPNEIFLGETDLEVKFPVHPAIQYKTEEQIEKLLKRTDVIKQIDSAVKCPLCKYEKKFSLRLEKDLFRRMEQELSFPDDLVYTCEKCGKWSVHLGRIMKYMYKKLGQKIPPSARQ